MASKLGSLVLAACPRGVAHDLVNGVVQSVGLARHNPVQAIERLDCHRAAVGDGRNRVDLAVITAAGPGTAAGPLVAGA